MSRSVTRLLLLLPPPACRLATARRWAHIRSGRHLEHVIYPQRQQLPPPPRTSRPRQPGSCDSGDPLLPAAASPLATREDLEAAWEAGDVERILSIDCRDMSSQDLALSLRTVASAYRVRHLGAAGAAALGRLRADPRLALLECMAAARARHLNPAQLCRLACDLAALRCHPDVPALPLALLNASVNDLTLRRLLSALWHLRHLEAAAAPALSAPSSVRELTLLRRQALAHLRARLHELETPPECVAAARAARLFGAANLAPSEVARLLGAARSGCARSSALDPAPLEAALSWRDLLPAALPPALRHLRECAEGMFELGLSDLDGLLCAQEALLAALATAEAPDPRLAVGLREFCELGPRVVARLPAPARPEDLVDKFNSDRRRLLPLAIAQ